MARQISAVSPDSKASVAQLALRWILDHPEVTTVIPGATRPEQADDNAAASALPKLKPEVHARLRDLYLNSIAQHIRGPY